MTDPLPIIPFTKAPVGEITLCGSKSITNRAILLAALSYDTIQIENALLSEDTLIMINALKTLGFGIYIDTVRSTITVQGTGGKIPKNMASIDVGNAGTVARFLTAILCLHSSGTYYLNGSAAMRKRPMRPLLNALESIGAATVIYHEDHGYFPFTLQTHGLCGGEAHLDASASSQMLSALLMIGPLALSTLSISFEEKVVSWPFVEMTLKMMKIFGQSHLPELKDNKWVFTKSRPYTLATENYWVEPDATAASYFQALVLILGGQLRIPGLFLNNSLQGDLGFTKILQRTGLEYEHSNNALIFKRSTSASLCGLVADFTDFSDTFLTFAAITPLLKSPSYIEGIGHTRFQETDRISAIVTELRKLKQRVIENSDSFTIVPQRLRSTIIDTYNDHRMAMSFAILGSYDLTRTGFPWLSIRNPACVAKTFPNFFETLNSLNKQNVQKLQNIDKMQSNVKKLYSNV